MQLRIFMIDDDVIQIDIMEEYIELSGVDADSEFHSHSKAAIEELEQRADDQLPHVIFMDLNMPKMNGWEFLEHVRQLATTKTWSPSVYMVSSSVLESDLLRAKAIPELKRFLNKPIRLEDLKELLKKEHGIHCPDP